jgi:hypothetical protein
VEISRKATTSDKVTEMDNIKMHLDQCNGKNLRWSELKQDSVQNNALLTNTLNVVVAISGQ